MRSNVKYLVIILLICFTCFTSSINAEEWMPDPALRSSIRKELGISENKPLILEYVKLHLTELRGINKNITSLTGLEHATDLQVLVLPNNKIQDISPLSELTGLVFLNLSGNHISDIQPLSGLTNLELLGISHNQIIDISALAGLVNLKTLNLNNNPIADISPVLGLENLKDLRIRNLDKDVFATIPISKLIQFGYNETCDFDRVSIIERINNREYPSIFAAWGTIINLPNLSWTERITHHDLYFSGLPYSSVKWVPNLDGLKVMFHVESTKEQWVERSSMNPNMLTIVATNYAAANPGEYPDDWQYWLRDEFGNKIGDNPLIDFTYPEYQDYLVRQMVMLSQCGFFDGILLDWWRDEWKYNENARYYTNDVHESAITLLRRIRKTVGDDFLILVNSNDSKIPRSAPYVNGMFMETIGPYTRQHLAEIESTLLWGEENLQEPKINCLEAWRLLTKDPLDSPGNNQRMRLFTTMSLVFSDGYVLFSDTYLEGHDHYWYPFWDADLGHPVGEKAQLYENQNGVFIREFTNGWAVYNRSGEPKTINLPNTIGTASQKSGTEHVIPDLDGEIYLKLRVVTPDVNGDGVVNILDLVLVADGLGTSEPDVNGDGIVNILDLVIVSNNFQ